MKPPYIPLKEHISEINRPYAYCCKDVVGNQRSISEDSDTIFNKPAIWWEFRSRHKGHKRGWTTLDTIDFHSKGIMDFKVRYKNVKSCPYCKRLLCYAYKRDMLYRVSGVFKDVKYLDDSEKIAKVSIRLNNGVYIYDKVKPSFKPKLRRSYWFKYKMTRGGEKYVSHANLY